MPPRLGAQILAILRDRSLAPIALALAVHGVSQGMTVPLIALWLVHDHGLGPPAIAAYFSAAAAGGLVLNPLFGRLSDLWGRRRRVAALAACLQAAGLLVLAMGAPFWLVLLAAAVLLSAQVQPHLFSLVHDYVGVGSTQRPRALTLATLRAMISAAWVVGAPLGGLLAGSGYGRLFALAGLCNALAAVVILTRCRDAVASGRGGRPDAPTRVRWGQLGLFGAATVLVVAGNTAKMQAVPLYLARLGLPLALVGATFGWMALAEMVLMPPAGRMADRLSRRGVIALGTLGGAIFFTVLALVPGATAAVIAFPGVSFMIAAVYGVGIGYVQELDPDHVGLAGGIFFAAQGVGTMLGGPLIAAGQAALGLPRAFLLPTGAILAGCLLVLVTRPAHVGTAAAVPPLPAAGD